MSGIFALIAVIAMLVFFTFSGAVLYGHFNNIFTTSDYDYLLIGSVGSGCVYIIAVILQWLTSGDDFKTFLMERFTNFMRFFVRISMFMFIGWILCIIFTLSNSTSYTNDETVKKIFMCFVYGDVIGFALSILTIGASNYSISLDGNKITITDNIAEMNNNVNKSIDIVVSNFNILKSIIRMIIVYAISFVIVGIPMIYYFFPKSPNDGHYSSPENYYIANYIPFIHVSPYYNDVIYAILVGIVFSLPMTHFLMISLLLERKRIIE